MNFFDALEWINWKNLTVDVKQQLFQQVLMYFVSPLKEIKNVEFVKSDYAGLKCETFQLEIDQERFVFVPGNQEAIIGWDLGASGLPAVDWQRECPKEQNSELEKLIECYHLETPEDWDILINESTSSLRKTAIPPMLVQVDPLPAGTKPMGVLASVSGEFTGDVEAFAGIEKQVRTHFTPPQSFEESLSWTFPEIIYESNHYYGELDPDSGDYRLYSHRLSTVSELQKHLEKEGFDLLSEDQWEYAVGAGTRRLFRWGNQLFTNEEMTKPDISDSIRQNIFGLDFPTKLTRWEITSSPFLKMERWTNTGIPLLDCLPYASYYRSRRMLHCQEVLNPTEFMYRKAILITKDA